MPQLPCTHHIRGSLIVTVLLQSLPHLRRTEERPPGNDCGTVAITELLLTAAGVTITDVRGVLPVVFNSTVQDGAKPEPLAMNVWFGRTTAEIQLTNTADATMSSRVGRPNARATLR